MSDYTPIQNNSGSFVPTTNVWDVGRLYEVDVKSPEFKELLVRLYQNVNNISIVLNTKDTAYYLLEEFQTSQLYFPTLSIPTVFDLRPGFRIGVNFGAIGPGTNTVAHNIPFTSTYVVVKLDAVANDTTGLNYYPLPWASAAGTTNIQITIDGTNIVIINNSGVTFDTCYVFLEYVKIK